MTFLQMQCFLSLAQTRKMSVTATALGLSLSTLSKHIGKMENELSVTLFSKSQRRTTLTREGEMIFPSIEYIVSQHIEQCVESQKYTDRKNMPTKIALALHQNEIIRQLIKFMEVDPSVKLHLTEASASEICSLIDEENADIGIVYDELIDKKYPTSLQLSRDKIVAVVSKHHPLADRGTISAAELKNETFFLFKSDHLMYQYQLRICISAGFVPNEIHGDMRISTILLSVASNNGVSLLVENTANMLPIEGIAVLRLEEQPLLTMTAISSSVYPTNAERKLLNFLRRGNECKNGYKSLPNND